MRLIPKSRFTIETKKPMDAVCSQLRKHTVKTRFGQPTESRSGKLFTGQIDKDYFRLQHSGYVPGQEKYNKSLFAPIVFGSMKRVDGKTEIKIRETLPALVRMVFLLFLFMAGYLAYLSYQVGAVVPGILAVILLLFACAVVSTGFTIGIRETNAYLEEVLGMKLK